LVNRTAAQHNHLFAKKLNGGLGNHIGFNIGAAQGERTL